MTLVGTLLLLLASIVGIAFNSMVYGSSGSLSTDAAIGRMWGEIYLAIAFFVLMTGVFAIATVQGGAAALSDKKGNAFGILWLALMALSWVMTLSALFRHEPNPPFPFGAYGTFAPWTIPAMLILMGALGLHEGLRAAISPMGVRVAAGFLLGIGGVGLAGAMFAWVSADLQRSKSRMQETLARDARIHEDHLHAIEACDVAKNMSMILVYTDRFHDPAVREAALTKIKGRKDYEAEIARALEANAASEAFVYLASNDVESKARFAEPIRKGILQTAQWVRRTIRSASHDAHLYPDQFTFEVDRILWTLERQHLFDAPYVSAVREFRAALNEPSSVKKPSFACASRLDRWIQSHE